jgi:hypothetical protein
MKYVVKCVGVCVCGWMRWKWPFSYYKGIIVLIVRLMETVYGFRIFFVGGAPPPPPAGSYSVCVFGGGRVCFL